MPKIKAYENKDPLIIFFPVRIRSSSPKLNFFIKIPVPTATAAAGVASFISQSLISSNAESSLDINLGSAAKTLVEKNKKNIIINKKIISIFFFFFSP